MKLIDDTIDLSEYLREPDPAERVVPASSFFDEVRDEFLNPQSLQGAKTPWPKADQSIRFRPGELSMWSGTNYTGKSIITSQVALSLCQQGERVCIASFEMKPRKTMYRMTRQAAGGPEPSMRFIKAFGEWTDGKLWLFDHFGRISPERMLAVVRYCAERVGITHIFIDSMMKVIRGEDDYNGQKDFANDLHAAAQQYNPHIHLIHHTKKPADESHRPTRFDAKGSGAISDQIDNAFNIWRDKGKESKLKAKDLSDADREKIENLPDSVLICDKQRHGEWDGTLGLWYDPEGMTFRDHSQSKWSCGMDLEYAQAEPGANG